ncbi:winged helix-turn-helix transcriptional regulator [soil metagenome]
MKTYGQFCPIARGSEIFATRWTPIIVRNMLLGCRTFGEITEGAPGIPRSLLSERLKDLEILGLVVSRPNPNGRGSLYELTEAGQDLGQVCDALGEWGARWLELAPEHLDPHLTLWSVCKAIDRAFLPEEPVTMRFEFADAPRGQSRFWLLVQRPEPEVCVKPPGFDENLVVRTDPEWLARWRLGETTLGGGMKARRVRVSGPRHMATALKNWVEGAGS